MAELGEVVRGKGSLLAGEINSGGKGGINVDGDVKSVELWTAPPSSIPAAILIATGDCTDVALHSGARATKHHPELLPPIIS